MGIGLGIIKLLELYSKLLVIRVLLTWFPNIRWENQPFSTLRQVCDIYLNQFRKIIPPIGMLDISPIVAFITLYVIIVLLSRIFSALGI